MKNIRIDEEGDLRCWNCGGKNFTQKRTMRSKVLVGVGALVTKKKMKCQSCGEYNDVGNAKPYNGPKSTRAARKAGTDTADVRPAIAGPAIGTNPSAAEQLQQYGDLLERGLLTPEEFEAKKSELL